MLLSTLDPALNTFLDSTRAIMASTALSSSGLNIFLGILISVPVLRMVARGLRAVGMVLELLGGSVAGE